jgi:hypothetical protein
MNPTAQQLGDTKMQLTILSVPAASRFVLQIDENATLETLKAAIFQEGTYFPRKCDR